MKQQARQDHIREAVRAKGSCLIKDLAESLGASEMTIRRDLDALAERGLVIRTHGGAAIAERISFEFEFLHRVNENRQAKEAIAIAAAELVADGQAIMMDSGTTTLALARRLRGRHGLTVITTSLPIAAELQYHKQARVLLLGGYLHAASPDVSGALAESNLEQLRADLAFIGCDAIDNEGAVFSEAPEVARLLIKMAASSQNAYVVADSSKTGKTALCRYGSLKDFDGLITDAGAPADVLKSLRRGGAKVIIAGAKG
jgi:DeoR/GlpR family transcriptional regulator of sugar metabolism